MKSNSSKLKTISSFFPSSPAKIRKINDQILNSSSISIATRTLLSETSNILSTIDANSSVDINLIATCDHSVSKVSSSKISPLSPTSSRATAAFSSLYSIITSTIGQRDDRLNEKYYRTHIYYQLIDNILNELEDRFSTENLRILSSISSLSPHTETFLHFGLLKPFADHLNFDCDILFNELTVVKPMIQKKSLTTIIDLYQEIYPFTEAFPILVALIESTITIAVSSTTCERTFSKMKQIKTTVRNTLTDDRLSNLCVIAVERDIAVNFEQLIDKFSDIHKNTRIMLK
ncbi:unnamed protein product [Adineta steineri]|uniref:HAT C-terminal dimerisation domain-containing protein n=1 Tax=Adineta steineri TaxID=433720 RepID=A0A814R8B9_9BILA|nr:unnamed protein product [Adineta steineri]CAF3753637.1 unnamed protein product [Adineta steineri]